MKRLRFLLLICLITPLHALQHFEQGGIAIDFTLEPSEGTSVISGKTAIVTFKVTDARNGQPLAGLRPRAWFSERRDESVATETPCDYKINSFLGGQLNARPDADLNGYLLLTMNHDKTITFLNPLIASSISRIESAIELPGVGTDWALTPDLRLLAVAIAEPASVVVIDTVSRKLLRSVDLSSLGKPGRLSLAPGGRSAWISIDHAPRVAVVDLESGSVRSAATGEGLHSITFRADGRFAYVTSSSSDSVSVIDTATLRTQTSIQVGDTPVHATISKTSHFLYVAALNSPEIAVIDTERNVHSADIPTGHGVVSVEFEPEGRFGFAVSQTAGRVIVFDSATNNVVTSAEVVPEPDQIAFTSHYAYVRGLGSEKFTLLDLANLRKQGEPTLDAVDIQAGRLSPGTEPGLIGPSPMIAPTPEGNSVFIANAADRMLYYYVEGGMASMGTLTNYKRSPRGLLVLDRSLAEILPGVFRAPVTLQGGKFDVPVLIDQPRLSHCFRASVVGTPATHGARLLTVTAKPILDRSPVAPGSVVTVRFRLTDTSTGKALDDLHDVQALIFAQPGVHQQRIALEGKGDGIYEGSHRPTEAGLYYVMLGIPSRNAGFSDLPYAVFRVALAGGAQ